MDRTRPGCNHDADQSSPLADGASGSQPGGMDGLGTSDCRFADPGLPRQLADDGLRIGDVVSLRCCLHTTEAASLVEHIDRNLPGALPVWMGWTAADGSLADPRAWILLGILVAWQLPHFMSIAWLYREQYASAGYKMITVTDKSGRGASWHAIVGSLVLLPLTVAALPPTSIARAIMCALGLAVSLWMLRSAIDFSRDQNAITSRRMLRVSLLHLPLMMLVILLSRLIG